MNPRILAIHLSTPPSKESLPKLAELCLKFSPRVGIRPPDTLYLDVASTSSLFGGEAKLFASVKKLLHAEAIVAHCAMADDLATAGALARHPSRKNDKKGIVPPGQNEAALAPLSTETLFFLANPLAPPSDEQALATRKITQVLSSLGIRTLEQYSRIPASVIAPRFGQLGVILHQRARGESFLPFQPFQPTQSYREQQTFEFPLTLLEPLLFTAKNLLAKLEKQLQENLHKALELKIYLENENCEEFEIPIPLLRPLRHESGLLQVVREKLRNFTFSAPLISLAIELSLPVLDRGSQFHLFDATEQQSEKLDELLGRLVAGLGPTFISAAALRERYRPEQSWKPTPFEPFAATPKKGASVHPLRPTILVSPPLPLQAKTEKPRLVLQTPNHERFEIASLKGPERLRGEWWDGEAHARDYFVAEAQSGQFLWIFKSLKKSSPTTPYFLHGYFD